MPKRPELLAPVGSWESMVAAVNNGADAVYLGGTLFSARANANNFDNEEMIKALEFCHLRNVKVYVTVNTLIADHELEQALDYLKFLYEQGVDAIIIQDIGLARLARTLLPNLELHASTQMTVHNKPGLELLLEQGFKRIVVAREMSLAEIKEIKESTGADIEVFIHGALCVCYSGQCLMSSLIGGRSGNRGRCAQPCRLAYTMVDREGKELAEPNQIGKHLLSPRDLNMIHHIPDLIEAGIDSFKIEGRMKRPEYVATVIRTYRQVIERYLENQPEFAVTPEEDKDLWQIFNRDFTDGYFYGNQGRDMMSFKRPNNRGVRLGRVSDFKSREGRVEIALEEPLHLGDGLEAWVTQGGRQGTVVKRIFKDGQLVNEAMPGEKVWVELPGKIRTGDRVFKTNDALLMEKAVQSYTSAKAGQKIPLQCIVVGEVGKPLSITFKHPKGLTGQAETEFIAEVAQKRPLTIETVTKQLERLGNTPYAFGELDFQVQGEIMVPVSEINEARRKAIEELEAKIMAANKPVPVDYGKYQAGKKEAFLLEPLETKPPVPKLTVTVGDMDSLKRAVLAGIDVVYLSGDLFRSKEAYNQEDISWAINFCAEKGVEMVYQTPRIDRSLWMKLPENIIANSIGVLVTNLGFLHKIPAVNRLAADFTLNIFNRQALLWLKELGVKRATLSPELTLEQVRVIASQAPVDVEYIIQGALPMMVSEYCAPGSVLGGRDKANPCHKPCQEGHFGLKDRLGMVFPVESDRSCRMHIFNPKELCLVEDIGHLVQAGVKYLRIEGKIESPETLEMVVKLYRQEIDRYIADPDNFRGNPEAKEKLDKLSPAGITKGHLYRGVI